MVFAGERLCGQRRGGKLVHESPGAVRRTGWGPKGSPRGGSPPLPRPPLLLFRAARPAPRRSAPGLADAPRARSPPASPLALQVPGGGSDEARPGGPITVEAELPPGPPRPTTPKPPSPRSPGAASGKCPSSVSALSLSSVDSEERAEGPSHRDQGPGAFPDAAQATCDQGSEDSGAGSQAPSSLGGAAPSEEKAEEVRPSGKSLVTRRVARACSSATVPLDVALGRGGPFSCLEAGSPEPTVSPSRCFLLLLTVFKRNFSLFCNRWLLCDIPSDGAYRSVPSKVRSPAVCSFWGGAGNLSSIPCS